MFPDKPPFFYKCTKCGHYFSSDKNLHAPSIFSSIPLDFENTETSENGNVIMKINSDDDNKKDSFFTKIMKNITYPKCPKCKEHAVVSIDSMIEK
ncbi:hypothetical protein Q5M87_11160 [Brachyspira innocens]|uniref:Zinc ribbon domain-containing protein n=1 Tax=Brachyspira innocens TaxID=13264 RepID=A0ABT8Z0D0_9SPIR|nr:hypothetical protein [Brachyspira innocens]MDO6994563.1 hypothetical protein [Brachyspira innocens]MDO7020839.1 hypothetical protein [Brachyspira innocens]